MTAAPVQDRLSELSAAILRMNTSPDAETALQEAVDSACLITGARHGVIATVENAGQSCEFVTSGISDEVRNVMLSWSDWNRLIEHLRDIDEPITHPSLPRYVDSLRLSALPIDVGTFQLTSLRRRGALVGGFFLVAKQGEFSNADSEVLVLLASQAAAAIENARIHRDAQRARTDLETLIETSPIGAVVFDVKTGSPTSVNAAAKRIVADLELPAIDADYLKTTTCRCSDGRTFTMEELPRANLMRAEEVEISNALGTIVRTLLNATPIHSKDVLAHTLIVTMQDLAPFEALKRDRTDFLTMVSHELRAPLAAVKGSAMTVLDSSRVFETTEMRQFFRIVEEQADRMDRVISDLLDAGHLATGTLPVSAVPISVLELLEQARRAFVGGAATHDVTINLQPDLPKVMADEFRIGQVLDNLLLNAARYAPASKPIQLSASLDQDTVLISVRDEGVSVDPSRLSRMFDRYSGQGHASEGVSLGLEICRGLVEAHGGRIQASKPVEGGGTEITFSLPVAEAAATASSTEFESSTDRQKHTVLVVDDDPHTLRHVKDALNSAGYESIVTDDPNDVPEMVRTHRPQLVILDLVLPGTDGIQIMREVGELGDLPVIFISAYGRGDTIAQALEAGADDYIVKPFSTAELVARVRAAERRRRGHEPFVLGELKIDYERRRVSIAGDEVRLTVTEYEVLRVLSVNAGRVMSYDALTSQVWRNPDDTSASTVRGLIKRLRRKLNDRPSNPRYILNVRGVGYRLPVPDESVVITN